MSSYYYTYDLSGNVTSVVYTSNLSISGITIPSVPVYSYPELSLSSLIYTPITISDYISLSGLFSGYSSYLSLSGIIASSNFFNYLTSSSYISPFTINYTISSNIYSITTTPYIYSTPWNKQYSTYLIGTLDISSQLIVRGDIICPNIIDQYARNYEISLSGNLWEYYNNLGSQINVLGGSSNVDQYARNYQISLSGNVNYQISRISELENKTTGLSYSALNSYFSTILNAGTCILQDTTINGTLQSNNNFTSTGYINFTNTTDSTSLNIAGVVAYGGLSVKKQLRVGNNVTIDGSTLLNGILNMGANTYLNNNTLYLRNDNYHYIKYGFRDGPCIAGNAGLSLGISNPSYSEIIGFSPTTIDLQKPTYLNNNALYLKSDTNHYLKYDATRDGPQLQGYGGGSLGVLNSGVYSEIIGYNNTNIYLQKPTTIAGDLIVQGAVLSSSSATITAPASGGTYFYNSSTTYIYVKSGVSGISINFTAINNKICQPVHIINTGSSISIVFAGSSGNTIITGTTASFLCFWTPWNDWMYYVL